MTRLDDAALAALLVEHRALKSVEDAAKARRQGVAARVVDELRARKVRSVVVDVDGTPTQVTVASKKTFVLARLKSRLRRRPEMLARCLTEAVDGDLVRAEAKAGRLSAADLEAFTDESDPWIVVTELKPAAAA